VDEQQKWDVVGEYLETFRKQKGTMVDVNDVFLVLYECMERLPDSLRGHMAQWALVLSGSLSLYRWSRGFTVVLERHQHAFVFSDLEHMDVLIKCLERVE
jgi:hypothetical protein